MRCLGRTNKMKRCKKEGSKWYFPFCPHHKIQPIVLVLITVPTLIGTYAGIYRDVIEPTAMTNPGTEKVFVETNRERFGFKPDSIYSGFGLYFVISVNSINQDRRKFIFDGGDASKNRISLYLDKADNLVYRILDNESEPHLLKIPQRLTTFKAGSTMVVFLDYGYKEDKSFMRILVNDRELGEKVFRYPINLPKSLNFKKFRIGCDFSGENCSDFYGMEFIAWSESFSEKKHKAILENVISAFNL
jgi:hypothetical protein